MNLPSGRSEAVPSWVSPGRSHASFQTLPYGTIEDIEDPGILGRVRFWGPISPTAQQGRKIRDSEDLRVIIPALCEIAVMRSFGHKCKLPGVYQHGLKKDLLRVKQAAEELNDLRIIIRKVANIPRTGSRKSTEKKPP